MTNFSASTYNLSHPELSGSTLTFRGPRSASSRTATTRRHRSNRSHHGGSSFVPQNEFPYFSQTGDVEIIIRVEGQENKYMLHRLILAQCSGFFEASTSQEWSRAQAQAPQQGPPGIYGQGNGLGKIGEEDSHSDMGRYTSSGPKPRWRYELDSDSQDDEVPMLVQKPSASTLFGGDNTTGKVPPARSKPSTQSTNFFRSVANLSGLQSAVHLSQSNAPSPENDIIRDYDNLFRIFYNYSPFLDSINIAEAYVQCKTLLALADMYDALEVVGPRIDHHLLQFQGRLWKQIAKYPPSYLKLGYLARSKVIFTEALIHVVGQWPVAYSQLNNHVPDSVLELIEDKVDELEDLKVQIEGRLFRLSLTTTKGERVNPSNAYLDWTALSLFRHWLAESTTPPPPPISKSAAVNTPDSRQPAPPAANQNLRKPLNFNSGKIYRLLGSGGSSYLDHDEMKRFMKLRPEYYSRESLRKFERRMDEVKNLAREIVKPLMKNHLELDLGRDAGTLGYLTCTKLEETDFPWV